MNKLIKFTVVPSRSRGRKLKSSTNTCISRKTQIYQYSQTKGSFRGFQACLKTPRTTLIFNLLLYQRHLALTSSCFPFLLLHIKTKPRTSRMKSSNSTTEPSSPLVKLSSNKGNRWLMAEKSLNMMGKMMYPNIIDYYIINCAIPSIISKSLPNWFW